MLLFPLVTPNPEGKAPTSLVWGSPPGGHVISILPYGIIPKSCLSKLPTPHPHGFKVQSSGAQGWEFLGSPPDSAPKRGTISLAWEFLLLQSCGARRRGVGQYWGAGAPDPPEGPGLGWDFICCTLARIFFWCPARVTPIRSRSLVKNGELVEAIGLPERLPWFSSRNLVTGTVSQSGKTAGEGHTS